MLSLPVPPEKHRFPKGVRMSMSRSSECSLDLSVALPDGLILRTVCFFLISPRPVPQGR